MAARGRDGPGPIRFGTSGWRGILGDEVTDERARAFAHGAASWLLRRRAGSRVVVGFDGRFASERLAGLVARVLRERGLDIALSTGVTPTPAVARAVPRRRAAGALVLTASHNQAQDHGIKLFGPRGEAIDERAAARVEQVAAQALQKTPRPAASPGRLLRVDLAADYASDLERALADAIRTTPRLRVVFDAMHGAGAGVFDVALRAAGTRVELLRGESDPLFAGVAPDPVPAQLRHLARRVRAGRGLRLGLATDGDADRIAAVDERGHVVADGELAALVLDHLARTGRVVHGVALTLGAGSLLESVAREHGLRATRHPIGFKHLAGVLLAGRAEIAVDESGGIAFSPFGFDKDGMFAGAMLVESVALRRMGLAEQLAELRSRHGTAVAGRTALPASHALRAGIERLREAPPARVDGQPVGNIDGRDGVRFELADGFVMWRASGTEPLVRIYAEASNPSRLRKRLATAERLLRRVVP